MSEAATASDVSVVVDKQKSASSVLSTASDARCCLASGLFQLLLSNIKCQEAMDVYVLSVFDREKVVVQIFIWCEM